MQAQDLAESGFLDHVGHLVGPIPEWNLEIPEFNLAQAHESNTGFGLTVGFLKTGWRLLILWGHCLINQAGKVLLYRVPVGRQYATIKAV